MSIESIFKNIRKTREQFTLFIEGLSLEEINQIPESFNNNIVWNYGHSVVTTPALCYQRTGVDESLNIPYQSAYGKDSKPSYFVESIELEKIKELAKTSIDQIERDYLAGKFNLIKSFSTGTYQVELSTIEDVLLTTLMHDNLHYGYALAQKRSKKH